VKTWRKVPWLSVAEAVAAIASLTEQVAAESHPHARMKLCRRLAFAGASMAVSEESISILEPEQGIAAFRR
jgi:hypothetical protein